MLRLWNRYWSRPQELLPPTQTQCGCLLLLGLPQNIYTRGCTRLAQSGGTAVIAAAAVVAAGTGGVVCHMLPRPVLTADSVGAQQHLSWSGQPTCPLSLGNTSCLSFPCCTAYPASLSICCLALCSQPTQRHLIWSGQHTSCLPQPHLLLSTSSTTQQAPHQSLGSGLLAPLAVHIPAAVYCFDC